MASPIHFSACSMNDGSGTDASSGIVISQPGIMLLALITRVGATLFSSGIVFSLPSLLPSLSVSLSHIEAI